MLSDARARHLYGGGNYVPKGKKIMAEELSSDSIPGNRVQWTAFDGRTRDGILIEWDNGTAIIRTDDGNTFAVRGR